MCCDQGEIVWNNINNNIEDADDEDFQYLLLAASSSHTNSSMEEEEDSHNHHFSSPDEHLHLRRGRHRNPLHLPPPPPPCSSSNLEQELAGVDDHHHCRTPDQTRLKRLKYSHLNHKGEEEIESHEESTSSLGLKLKKSPSLIDLVERRLSKGRVPSRSNSNSPDHNNNNNSTKKPSSSKLDYGSLPMSEKLKASNFPALYLKIGNWERISQNEGDLVAKCYYAKKKLVWEILEGALKSKIEIQWSDIIGIRATVVEDEPGTLEIELSQAPSFFRETNPQPRKHTLWQPTEDFTGGEAPTYSIHYVKFAPGALDKHYEKLLQCHPNLQSISRKPFPTQPSPYFRRHNSYDLPSNFVLHGYGSHLHQFSNPNWTPQNQPDLSNLRWSGLEQYPSTAALNNMMVLENGTIYPSQQVLPHEGLRSIPQANVGPLNYIQNHLLGENHQMICSSEDLITQDHIMSMQNPLALHHHGQLQQIANIRATASAAGGMMQQDYDHDHHTLMMSLQGQQDYRDITAQPAVVPVNAVPLMNWEIVEDLSTQQASIKGSPYDQYH
ncbi:OLC1v1002017C2 [Oldenlandia corymbosa var. corymbosa]|nr:OLC1v1002017C2 [Oldenlandia corymbosa var. corymbosa]